MLYSYPDYAIRLTANVNSQYLAKSATRHDAAEMLMNTSRRSRIPVLLLVLSAWYNKKFSVSLSHYDTDENGCEVHQTKNCVREYSVLSTFSSRNISGRTRAYVLLATNLAQ